MRGEKIKISQDTGVTLVEIIVVVALIGILSSITIANYREFDRRAVLGNLAYDVSLSIRLAQSYGLNVRGVGGVFDKRYGIHFANGTPSEYILFELDRSSGSYRYITGGVDVNTYTLNGGYAISDVCAVQDGGAVTDCFSAGMTRFNILFDRPKPDSVFTSNTGASYESVTITVTGPTGLSRNIEVLSTGYVSVQ